MGYFEIGSQKLFCLGRFWTVISVSWVARITGTSHQCLALVYLLRQALTVSPRMVSFSWAQVILLPQPLKCWVYRCVPLHRDLIWKQEALGNSQTVSKSKQPCRQFSQYCESNNHSGWGPTREKCLGKYSEGKINKTWWLMENSQAKGLWVRSAAPWYNTCLACKTPWIWSLEAKKKIKKNKNKKEWLLFFFFALSRF
jgi:hypothetical protein